MTGRLGQLGLVLIGLAAAIALTVDFSCSLAHIAPCVPVTSALTRLTGDVLVAVLTIRVRVSRLGRVVAGNLRGAQRRNWPGVRGSQPPGAGGLW
jgi:hypothetical protein